jgi:hypothetical protein
MTTENTEKNSQLLVSLREGVSLVQMILYKELRQGLEQKNTGRDRAEIGLLAGSVTNEVFGTRNPEPRFAKFVAENWGKIEQELLGLKDKYAFICKHVTDALRIQALCDHQEKGDSSGTLLSAKKYGYLIEEREVPLPSTFMTTVRELGKQHNLIAPPVQITPEDDQSMIH